MIKKGVQTGYFFKVFGATFPTTGETMWAVSRQELSKHLQEHRQTCTKIVQLN